MWANLSVHVTLPVLPKKQSVVCAHNLWPCVWRAFPLSINLCFQAYRGRSGKTKAFMFIWGLLFSHPCDRSDPATPWGHTHDTVHPASHWPFLTSLWACVLKKLISINCISCWSPLSLCHWLCRSNTSKSGFEGAASMSALAFLKWLPLGAKSHWVFMFLSCDVVSLPLGVAVRPAPLSAYEQSLPFLPVWDAASHFLLPSSAWCFPLGPPDPCMGSALPPCDPVERRQLSRGFASRMHPRKSNLSGEEFIYQTMLRATEWKSWLNMQATSRVKGLLAQQYFIWQHMFWIRFLKGLAALFTSFP